MVRPRGGHEVDLVGDEELARRHGEEDEALSKNTTSTMPMPGGGYRRWRWQRGMSPPVRLERVGSGDNSDDDAGEPDVGGQ